MLQRLTKERKETLMGELQKLEDFLTNSPESEEKTKLLNNYFPHTLYEIGSIMEESVDRVIEYKETEIGTKIQ